eukprot:TRINITY_DN1555_c0_g1_i2.p1 TRINITY_DN1555_c0_g1~~TRINITY_DN1555_c0_g1_i2.p1  ORF type:complete len:146 (-),score=50.42 TRINITY_DN1555_c0_g1_i2:204-641(-)
MKAESAQNKQQENRKRRVGRLRRAPVRLWEKAVFLGYRRSKVDQNENQALIRVQGVNTKQDQWFWLGKRVAYIYRVQNTVNNSRFRVIWGRIARAHGGNGVFIARFNRNLPPRAIGYPLRVFLYPNRSELDAAALRTIKERQAGF